MNEIILKILKIFNIKINTLDDIPDYRLIFYITLRTGYEYKFCKSVFLDIKNTDLDSYIYYYYISMYENLSEDFIRKYKDKVDWDNISRYQILSEKFIREFADKVDWDYICMFKKLSESFIREFKDKVNWKFISEYQKLSEYFIREFQDKVDWYYISEYQKLSEDFINEFIEKISYRIVYNLKISNKIKKKSAIKILQETKK